MVNALPLLRSSCPSVSVCTSGDGDGGQAPGLQVLSHGASGTHQSHTVVQQRCVAGYVAVHAPRALRMPPAHGGPA